MRWTAARTTLAIGLIPLAGCQIDKLVDAPPTGALATAPAHVEVTAAAGSSASRDAVIAVRGVHDDTLAYVAVRRGGSPWLTVLDSAGTAPDSLHLRFDPSGLAAGTYRDTLVLTPDAENAVPTRVPVSFTLTGCEPAATAIGATITDSLRATDCASPHHPDRPARRYRFSAEAGDSVSFRATSATVALDLIVDSSLTGAAPPLAESTTCAGAGGACVAYLRFPAAASYIVEVTSAGTGAVTGPFTLTLSRPHLPGTPDSLRQVRADSATAISVGGAVPDPEIVIRAGLGDPDIADTLRLEVEIEPVGTDFAGAATATSDPVVHAGTAYARLTGLVDGTSYHWRSRVTDQTGRATPWQSFGGNPEGAADLRIAVAADRLRFQQAPTTTMAGEPITPAIQVAAVDRAGVLVSSFTGTVTLTLGGGASGAVLSGVRSVSAVDGVATFPGLSIDKAGESYLLVASAGGLVDATSPTFAITPGAPARLAFTQQPSNTTPGTMITPAVAVTALDADGNVVTGFTGAVTIAIGHDASVLGNAQLSGTLTVNAAAGVARFSDLRIDQPGIGYTLSATGGGLPAVSSAAFDIAPLGASATEQRFTAPPSSTATGSTISPPVEVTVLDARGAPVSTYTDAVTLALSGGTAGAVLGGTTSVVPSGGVARFTDLSVDRAGTGYRLRATAPDLPEVLSIPFDVTTPPPPPPTPTHLDFLVQPPAVTAVGGNLPVTISALDPQGRLGTAFTGPVTVQLLGGILGTGLAGTTTVDAAGGVAVFGDLHLTGPCVSCQLRATSPSLADATSAPFTVVAP